MLSAVLRQEVCFYRGREKGQRCCLAKCAASWGYVARDKGQHLPRSQQPQGVKKKAVSLATACQLLPVHPSALAASAGAELMAPWHKKDQAKEVTKRAVGSIRFIFSIIRQGSWRW